MSGTVESNIRLAKNVRMHAVGAKRRNILTGDIRDTCLNFDLYAKPVRMRLHGHDQFRTRFGAFCTIAVGFIVSIYAMIAVFAFVDP